MSTQAKNHPPAGKCITVDPIRSMDDVAEVAEYLEPHKRNHTMFLLGVNTNLRAGDLLKLTMGDIDWFMGKIHVKEGKTKKNRAIDLSMDMLEMLVAYCNPDRKYRKDELLFPSSKGGGLITVSSFNNMVKKWCRDCDIRGNHGSHTLRKTWAYMQHNVFKTDMAVISQEMNHSSMKVTFRYLGITDEERRVMFSHFIGKRTTGRKRGAKC